MQVIKNFPWKEFKPTVFFVTRFLGIYLIGNLLYGLFITSFNPAPDPVTKAVTYQTAAILNTIESPVTAYAKVDKPMVVIKHLKPIVGVFEGCNGLNVVIVFLAFLFAFGPRNKKLLWFVPLGILAIHVTNIFRIGLLFFVSKDYPKQLYFFHKYLLTAFIYGIVFILWFVWLRINKKKTNES
jgi:exosortase family protein XrtF